MPGSISIIVPALNEAKSVGQTLDSVRGPAYEETVELIVVDGGSEDKTQLIARAGGATVVKAARGRASQMNAGARIARGETLLFLHADTRLRRGFVERGAPDARSARCCSGSFFTTD